MTVVNPFDFFVEPYENSFPFEYSKDQKTEPAPYLSAIAPLPLFAAWKRPRRMWTRVSIVMTYQRSAQSVAR